MKNRYSYSSLGEIPYKTFLNRTIIEKIYFDKKWSPIHAVIIPTNACNIRCSFCNCDNRNMKEELSWEDIQHIIDILDGMGVKAITLSGGGEPTLHKSFVEIVELCKVKRLPVGLVTNGTNMELLKDFEEGSFSWIRVSSGDGRDEEQLFDIVDGINELLNRRIAETVGLSYIVTEHPNEKLITKLQMDEVLDKVSYVKFLGDCFSNSVDTVQLVRDNKKVIRAAPFPETQINTMCMLPLIKPIFAADGYAYPCCDIQYQDQARAYKKDMRICHYREYEAFIEQQSGIYVERCLTCYHAAINRFMVLEKDGVKNSDWI